MPTMKVINDSEHINMKKTDLGGDDLTRGVEFCEGSHENIYIQDFDCFVRSVICDNGKIYDDAEISKLEIFQKYLDLSEEEKEKKLRKIDKLLERISLEETGNSNDFNKENKNETFYSFESGNFQEYNQSSDLLLLSHNKSYESSRVNRIAETSLVFKNISTNTVSANSISRVKKSGDKSKKNDQLPSLNDSFKILSLQNEVKTDSFSDSEYLSEAEQSSIELLRGKISRNENDRSSSFKSPICSEQRQRQKRVASTSGRKGADLHRLKHSNGWGHHDIVVASSYSCNGQMFVDHHNEDSSDIILDSPVILEQDEQMDCSTISFFDINESRIEKQNSPSALNDLKTNVSKNLMSGENYSLIEEVLSENRNVMERNAWSIPRALVKERRFDSTYESLQKTLDCECNEVGSAMKEITSTVCQIHDSIQSCDEDITREETIGTSERLYQLKKGTAYRIEPLELERTTLSIGQNGEQYSSSSSDGHLTFPDPFSSFSTRTRKRLSMVVSWLKTKEMEKSQKNCWRSDPMNLSSKGLILSLTLSNTQAVILKMMKSIMTLSSGMKNTTSQHGGTLIVFRDKKYIDSTLGLLREKSNFSVINHCSLSVARKKKMCASQFTGYDIVLSTFDSIKAKEKVQPMDERGHVKLTDEDKNENGWLSTRRNGELQPCMSLSLLHKICWSRVFFIDILGRSSYICKESTSRMLACKALNAQSRFIFLTKEDENNSDLICKLKEDIKQMRTLSSVLHLPEDRPAELILGKNMINFEDIVIEH